MRKGERTYAALHTMLDCYERCAKGRLQMYLTHVDTDAQIIGTLREMIAAELSAIATNAAQTQRSQLIERAKTLGLGWIVEQN